MLVACNKTQPPTPPSGFDDPVFMVTYQDTTPITIIAGLDGVYHFTKLVLGSDDVYTSINTLADANCPAGDCPGSLSFEFRRIAITDSIFSGGQYAYTTPDSIISTPEYSVEILWGGMNLFFPQRKMVLVGTDSSFFFSPIVGITTDLPDIPHDMYVTGLGNNGPYGITYQKILPSNRTAYPGVRIKTVPSFNGFSLTAMPYIAGSSVTEYLWSTGDTSAMIFRDSNQVLQPYSVTVSDNEGNTASATLGEVPIALTSEIENILVSIESTPKLNPLQLGTVAIQWVDSDSKIWRSNLGEQQPGNSIFKVISSEHYEVNELGNPTLKLVIVFKCLLYTEEGGSRWFEGEGIIAMARP